MASCVVHWDTQTATCPNGRRSVLWLPTHDRHAHPVIHIRCARADCHACAVRTQCTQSAAHPRMCTLRTRPVRSPAGRPPAVDDRRFKQEYARRAGVEGTISQAVRAADLRHARSIGVAKTPLQNLVTAAALYVLRVAAWVAERPRAPTRRSPCAALASRSPSRSLSMQNAPAGS